MGQMASTQVLLAHEKDVWWLLGQQLVPFSGMRGPQRGSHRVVFHRASEKQAWGSRSHTTFSGHMEPLGHKWQIPEGNKQVALR